jgi:hypothetical protein
MHVNNGCPSNNAGKEDSGQWQARNAHARLSLIGTLAIPNHHTHMIFTSAAQVLTVHTMQ